MNEALMTACRHEVALRDRELEVARQQLGAQEQSIVDLSRELENREWQSKQLEQRLQDQERAWAVLDAEVQAILQSKRWILICGVRAVLYSLPRLIRSTWRRVSRNRSAQQCKTVPVPMRRSLAASSSRAEFPVEPGC